MCYLCKQVELRAKVGSAEKRQSGYYPQSALREVAVGGERLLSAHCKDAIAAAKPNRDPHLQISVCQPVTRKHDLRVN